MSVEELRPTNKKSVQPSLYKCLDYQNEAQTSKDFKPFVTAPNYKRPYISLKDLKYFVKCQQCISQNFETTSYQCSTHVRPKFWILIYIACFLRWHLYECFRRQLETTNDWRLRRLRVKNFKHCKHVWLNAIMHNTYYMYYTMSVLTTPHTVRQFCKCQRVSAIRVREQNFVINKATTFLTYVTVTSLKLKTKLNDKHLKTLCEL